MEINGSGLETELRLGLPGGGDQAARKEKKRDFSDISGEGRAESKNQVVGWPPVAAFRRKNSFNGGGSKMYVKVSMDGAPFLRKIDLSSHKCYSDLVAAVEELFACGGIENNYCPIYEDKDGDWMLLGDVPWEMFVESCRRLRIMKGSDAEGIGLEAKDLLKGLGKEEVENN